MTRIDFYKLAGGDSRQRQTLACRIIEKAWRTGIKIYILAADNEEARLFDNLLWTFRQGSFIPHALVSEDGRTPENISILIGTPALPPAGYTQLLIDMRLDSAGPIDIFDRVVVVLNEEPHVLQLGRQRYKEYREAGHAIETHFLDAAGNVAAAAPR